jgi:hypothetical protein
VGATVLLQVSPWRAYEVLQTPAVLLVGLNLQNDSPSHLERRKSGLFLTLGSSCLCSLHIAKGLQASVLSAGISPPLPIILCPGVKGRLRFMTNGVKTIDKDYHLLSIELERFGKCGVMIASNKCSTFQFTSISENKLWVTNDPKLGYKGKPFPFVDPGEAPRIDVNAWR